jgi:glycosyltransferase involved in cell wall biosynthesis
MKVLILLLYYERPNLVRNALRSIVQANEHHQDWEVVVIDDGSEAPALPIVAEFLAGHCDQVKVIETRMTAQDKLRDGCLTGLAMNQAIEHSDADIGIMLCDDDALYPTYLRDLSRFFTENPDTMSCYSKVIVYDALHKLPEESTDTNCPLNRHTGPINGNCMVDASQGAWRLRCNKEFGARFPDSQSRNHDGALYDELYRKCGPMLPTGVIGQYKGIHERELVFVGPEKAWTEKKVDKESPAGGPEPRTVGRFFVASTLVPATQL